MACGTGFLTQHLAGRVVGLDQSAAMVRIALLICAASLLAGCAGDVVDHDNGRWLVTHRSGETDYEMGDRVLFAVDSAQVSSRASVISSWAQTPAAFTRMPTGPKAPTTPR